MIRIQETKDPGVIALLNEEVQALHADLHPEIFKPFDKEEMTGALAGLLASPGYRAYIALSNGIAAGYILLCIREVEENAFHYSMRCVYVDQIAVLKKYRRSGAGALLLQRAEELAREFSIDKLELDHWSSNAIAASYFRKQGYCLYKERLFKLVK